MTTASRAEAKTGNGLGVEAETADEAEAANGVEAGIEIAVGAETSVPAAEGLADESRLSIGTFLHRASNTSHPCSTKPCRPRDRYLKLFMAP